MPPARAAVPRSRVRRRTAIAGIVAGIVTISAAAAACDSSGPSSSSGGSVTSPTSPTSPTSDGDEQPGAWVADVHAALAAVEAELGAGQRYFEVTASPLVTNVFVAVDEASAAIPYAFLDGELAAPAPRLDNASGATFTADRVAFDGQVVLDDLRRELPDSTIETFSVEGGPDGSVRYIAGVRSAQGGILDVEIGADGTVLGVTPR